VWCVSERDNKRMIDQEIDHSLVAAVASSVSVRVCVCECVCV